MTATIVPPDPRPRQRQLDRLVDQALAYYRGEPAGGKIALRQARAILADLDAIVIFDRDARRALQVQALAEVAALLGAPAEPLGGALREAGWVE